jgi:hypothetical protein
MDRGPQFPLEMRYSRNLDDNEAPEHSLTAHHPNGTKAGEMHWFGEDDRKNLYPQAIGKIDVPIQWRRQGIATAMWEHAHKLAASNLGIPAPIHHPERTAEGHAWSRAVTPDAYERGDYEDEWEDYQ